MKTTICNFIALTAAVIGLAGSAEAQGTRLTMTTTSAAATATATTVTLTSSTGVSASGTGQNFTTLLYVDRELMGVKSLVSGTTWNVQRGAMGTRPQAHLSGAEVFIGPPSGNFHSTQLSGEVSGTCTVTAQVTLPLIYTASGNIYDCLGGKWVRGVRPGRGPGCDHPDHIPVGARRRVGVGVEELRPARDHEQQRPQCQRRIYSHLYPTSQVSYLGLPIRWEFG